MERLGESRKSKMKIQDPLTYTLGRIRTFFVLVFVIAALLKAILQPDVLGIIIMASLGLAFFLEFIVGDD